MTSGVLIYSSNYYYFISRVRSPGGDFDDGDPNIKPVPAAAPVWDGKGYGNKIKVTFPAQKQFLTKLTVEVTSSAQSALLPPSPAH